jgi:hypothetical protein
VGGIIYGNWFAGEAAYMLRVGVHMPDVKIERAEGIDFWLPPLQLHVIMAGCAVSLALVSFAITIRRITGIETVAPAPSGEPTDPVAMLRSLSPDSVFSRVDVPGASRFWLLTTLLAILAMLGGWYVLARESDAFTQAREQHLPVYKFLWNLVKPDPANPFTRRFLHVAAGGAIVLMPLLLALLSRVAPRRRGLLTIASLILFAAIAIQVWLGTLLMWDTIEGPATRFNGRATTIEKHSATDPFATTLPTTAPSSTAP